MTTLTTFHALFIALFLSLTLSTHGSVPLSSYPCAHDQYPPSALSAQKAGWFDVDLGQPPEQRWLHVIRQYEPQLAALKTHLMPYLNKQLGSELANHHLNSLDEFYDLAFIALPNEAQREMKGIFEAFPRVDREMLIAMNLLYELTTACTSIVARQSVLPTDGLIHGRNMDGYGVMTALEAQLGRNYMRDAVLNVNFWREGKILYRGTHIAGLLFPMDGLKEGRFSYSINQRALTRDIPKIIGHVLDWAKGEGGLGSMGAAEPLLLSIRRLFEEKNSFQEAKAFMASTPHLSPAYFILGGVEGDDGAIVTSGGIKGAVENLPNTTLAETSQAGAPWVLQTNSDHGGHQGTRCQVGNECMKLTYDESMPTREKKEKRTSPMAFDSMFDVLSTSPVLNSNTVFTSLMEVKTGKMETWLRGCAPACQPKTGPVIETTTTKITPTETATTVMASTETATTVMTPTKTATTVLASTAITIVTPGPSNSLVITLTVSCVIVIAIAAVIAIYIKFRGSRKTVSLSLQQLSDRV